MIINHCLIPTNKNYFLQNKSNKLALFGERKISIFCVEDSCVIPMRKVNHLPIVFSVRAIPTETAFVAQLLSQQLFPAPERGSNQVFGHFYSNIGSST